MRGVLIVFVAFQFTLSLGQPDPTCSRGIKTGGACCPLTCGICGGAGCTSRPGGGDACCRGIIAEADRGCDFVAPPCLINGSNPNGGSSNQNAAPSNPSVGPIKRMPRWKSLNSEVSGSYRARAEGCFVMVDGKAYLMGGRGGRIPTNVFNPRTRKWNRRAPPPFEFHHAKCVAVRFLVFVPVSWRGPFPFEKQNSRMLVYNTRTNIWTTREGLPQRRRRAAAGVAVFDEKIWVVGGARDGHGVSSTTVGYFDYYDLVERKWVIDLPRLPVKRDHTGAEIVGGRLCVAGGRLGESRNFYSAVVVSTFCYDFDMKVWVNVGQPIPVGRSNSMYGKTCGGKMLVGGGERTKLTPFKRVDSFDGEKWRPFPNLLTPRHGTGFATAHCPGCAQVFVAGGQGMRESGMMLNSTEVYLPDGRDRICKIF